MHSNLSFFRSFLPSFLKNYCLTTVKNSLKKYRNTLILLMFTLNYGYT
nr:MAG TPA: hypothetical protein [Caudoviricetes sp.]DAQ88388.1 MAG TPA: hypothetical protein [Caudoviricetes sp.]